MQVLDGIQAPLEVENRRVVMWRREGQKLKSELK
jgi:hypothetical protein